MAEDKKGNALSDEEMIIAIREGESRFIDILMDKYKNLVKSLAKDMFILGAEHEDLLQEGMIGLFKAVRDFDFGRDASFSTYANLCISRQMYNAIQASNRQKHFPLNSYVSIYKDDSKDEMLEINPAMKSANPEDVMIDRENVEDIEKKIEEALSDFEKQVLDLFLIGMGYVEIARILGKDEKSTDNALQRAKGKLKRILGNI